MPVVNTTFYVEPAVEALFLAWVRDVYVSRALTDFGLERPQMMRLLAQMEGDVGYAIQFHASTRESLDRWIDEGQQALLDDVRRRWGERVMHFTTQMEEVAL